MTKKVKFSAIILSLAFMLFLAIGNSSVKAGAETLTDEDLAKIVSDYQKGETYKRVSVHDPSIVVGYYEGDTYDGKNTTVYGEQNAEKTRKEIYFIFGSHTDFAYSLDLKNWTKFTNNITRNNAESLFQTAKNWSSKGDSVYNLGGNLWAPDVIWNPYYNNGQGAWMMYMSVNGCSWNSSIVLLTATSLNGDWKTSGAVIYSGFDDNNYDYTRTDYRTVMGAVRENINLASRYITNNAFQWSDGNTKCSASKWNTNYGAHAIDPSVSFDENGNLWMTYGSWSGGIWMIKLNKDTGKRDTSVKYTYEPNRSDPYMGFKIAGGDFASGEASYIQKIGNKYYLFVTNGGLNANGGYNMRLYSSSSITGPYVDMSGQDARVATNTTATVNHLAEGTYSVKVNNNNEFNINGTLGNRVMSYYKWSHMNFGYVAEGHNSAFVDDDGKSYIIYHTRKSNTGEAHQVRVHQVFQAKNGGLVTAPFEYHGETLSKESYDAKDIVGTFHILTMGDTNYASLECVLEKEIVLTADGKVTGEYTGTWTQDNDGPYVTLNLGGVKYQGVFLEQKKEETNLSVLCLSVVGENDISIWGYGNVMNNDKAALADAVATMDPGITSSTYSDLKLPTTANSGATVTWTSSNEKLISKTGKVGETSTNQQVTLTATITKGEYTYKKTYTTTVIAGGLDAIDLSKGLEALYNFNGNLVNSVNNSQVAQLLATGSVEKPALVEDASKPKAKQVLHLNLGEFSSGDTGSQYSYAKMPNPLKGKNAQGATISMWIKPNDSESDVWNEIWSFYDDNETRFFLTRNIFLGYNHAHEEWFDCNNGATQTKALAKGQWYYLTVSVDKDGFYIYINGELKYTKSQNVAFAGSEYDETMGKSVLSLMNTANNFYLGYGGFWRSTDSYMDDVSIYSKALAKEEVEKLYASAIKDPETEESLKETSSTPKTTSSSSSAVKVGKKYTIGKFKYKVTSTKKKTVTLIGVKSKKLKTATIGATVKIKGKKYKITKIGNSAFAKCKKLKKVTIGKNVTSIGKKAFYGCKKLKTIVIKTKKLKTVGKSALKNIAKKAKIKVPAKSKKKYKKILKGKGQSKKVKITK